MVLARTRAANVSHVVPACRRHQLSGRGHGRSASGKIEVHDRRTDGVGVYDELDAVERIVASASAPHARS